MSTHFENARSLLLPCGAALAVTVCLFAALNFPTSTLPWAGLVFLAVLAVVYHLHPERRFWRLGVGLCAAASGIGLPSFRFEFDAQGLKTFHAEYGSFSALNVAFLVAGCYVVTLEYLRGEFPRIGETLCRARSKDATRRYMPAWQSIDATLSHSSASATVWNARVFVGIACFSVAIYLCVLAMQFLSPQSDGVFPKGTQEAASNLDKKTAPPVEMDTPVAADSADAARTPVEPQKPVEIFVVEAEQTAVYRSQWQSNIAAIVPRGWNGVVKAYSTDSTLVLVQSKEFDVPVWVAASTGKLRSS